MARPFRVPPELWADYLDGFHAEKPGVAESVISRSMAGFQNPYSWLSRAVSSSALNVLDVTCGSGAMSRELEAPERMVIGLDISSAEIQQAARRSEGPFVQGDVLALPFIDEAFDAVTCSMGLAVVRPVDQMIAEVSRVLKTGGIFAALMPAERPLRVADVPIASKLALILRSLPRFPGALELTVDPILSDHGLRRVENARALYHYPVRTLADAEIMVSALYLPKTRDSRFTAAVEYLAAKAEKDGVVQIPIPMRRIIAIK